MWLAETRASRMQPPKVIISEKQDMILELRCPVSVTAITPMEVKMEMTTMVMVVVVVVVIVVGGWL